MTAEQGSQTPEIEALRVITSDARKKYIEARDMAQKVLSNVFKELAVPQGEKSIFTIETEEVIAAATIASEYLGDIAQAWIPRRAGGIVIVDNRRENAVITFRIGKDSKEPGQYEFFDGFCMYIGLDLDKPWSIPEITSRNSVYNSKLEPLPQESHEWIARNFEGKFKREDRLTRLQFAAEFLSRLAPVSAPAGSTS